MSESNPLRVGLLQERGADPCVIVIFGATGDLTKRKLMPALFALYSENLLPRNFAVVAFARRDKSHDEFREEMRAAVNEFSRVAVPDAVWHDFASGIFYHRSDFATAEGYTRLGEVLQQLDNDRGTAGNRLYYLATPPTSYATIIDNLGAAGLARPDRAAVNWARIIIEKPFGRDLSSAAELNSRVSAVFREQQVFRIDHYLGKETVQNILVFRFSNELFEPLWNQKYIDHVQITVAESVGVEQRAGYFETAGVMRDMVQNHMMQLLCLVGMEPPAALDADAIRDEKVKLLRALRPITPEAVDFDTVRGQYAAGWSDGSEVPGYRQEEGVAPDSVIDTFVALRLFIDNWRWAGVPFYLRSGKRLPKRATEIAVQFRNIPHILFARQSESIAPNVLVLRIQPDEGISLRVACKIPGQAVRIQPVRMDFQYGTSFGIDPPEAYERLLLDAMLGDSTLFTRGDEAEASWRFITPILEAWAASGVTELPTYPAGTWGPEAADAFIRHPHRSWRRL